MVAINPKKNLHFGENPPEINLNSNLKGGFRGILVCGNQIEHIFLMKHKKLII